MNTPKLKCISRQARHVPRIKKVLCRKTWQGDRERGTSSCEDTESGVSACCCRLKGPCTPLLTSSLSSQAFIEGLQATSCRSDCGTRRLPKERSFALLV